jgi:hypothetical protein
MLSLAKADRGQTRPDRQQAAAFAHTFAVPVRDLLRDCFVRHGFEQMQRASSSHEMLRQPLRESGFLAILTQYIDE